MTLPYILLFGKVKINFALHSLIRIFVAIITIVHSPRNRHGTMKVAIIGTRGIPARYGGFETFAQELSVRLNGKGMEITVICPKTDNPAPDYNGVKLLYADVTKDEKPMRYYIDSAALAVKQKFDIVLTCGQGGYAYIPHLWRRKSSRPIFITNTDGIEHRRTKWNKIVRLGVRFVGEMTSVILSDYLVADSKGIKSYLEKEYRFVPDKKIFTIEYGAEVLDRSDYPEEILDRYGLKPGEYYLVVSRLEPENNVAMIIEGFKKAKTGKPLIVVGNLKATKYIDGIQESAKGADIRFIGGVYEPALLKALRIHAAAYLHGHSVGGTNPSLLEALGAGNIVIGHDNPFNREVTDNAMFYFSTPAECAEAIEKVENLGPEEIGRLKRLATDRIAGYYNWDRIAEEYGRMFAECMESRK